MALSSARSIVIAFTGLFAATNTYAAAVNAASPNQTDVLTLPVGNTTITPPTGGSTPTGVTIIPPAGYAGTITLKGVAGDAGIQLHSTDPTSLAIGNPTGTFVLVIAGSICTGLRLVWS